MPLMLGPAQPKALSLLHGWLPDHSTDLPVGGKSQFLKQLESHSWQSHVHRQTHARIQGTNFIFFFPVFVHETCGVKQAEGRPLIG